MIDLEGFLLDGNNAFWWQSVLTKGLRVSPPRAFCEPVTLLLSAGARVPRFLEALKNDNDEDARDP